MQGRTMAKVTRNVPRKTSDKQNPRAQSLMVLLVVLIYGQTLFFGFTDFDDYEMIVENAVLHQTPHRFSIAFTTDAWFRDAKIELYRPLQSLSYMVENALAGTRPAVYHTTNLFLFCCCSLLIFQLLLRIGFSNPLALAGAVLFSAHYQFVSTVAWVPARGDLLLTLFVLLSFMAFLKYLSTTSKAWLAVHVLYFCCGLFSKETATILPVVVVIYAVTCAKVKIPWQDAALTCVGYCIVVIPYLILRNTAIAHSYHSISTLGIIRSIPILLESTAKFFYPINISVMPFCTVLGTSAGAAILGVLVFLVVRGGKGVVWPGVFGLLWYCGFHLPALIYRPVLSEYAYEYLDHRSYLPAIGLLIAVMGILRDRGFPSRRYAGIVYGGILLTVTALSLYFVRYYRGPSSYVNQVIRTSPQSAFAWVLRGKLEVDANDFAHARRDFDQALRLKPDFSRALTNRGMLNFKTRRYEESVNDYRKALLVEGPNMEMYNSRNCSGLYEHDLLVGGVKALT